MECKHFGECGSCQIYNIGYMGQLSKKRADVETLFNPYFNRKSEIFASEESHYRARAEFRIWHKGEELFYAMSRIDKKGIFLVQECPMVADSIEKLMFPLLNALKEADITHKLFGIEFLSSGSSVVVSLLYHKRIGDEWHISADRVAKYFNISIVGRSRKQKVVIGEEFVVETLNVNSSQYLFKQVENSFTQPNPRVNEKMIEWTTRHSIGLRGDLLELYCGAGNFTIAFAEIFNKILATEISKSSIRAAKENSKLNGVDNITFVRMSAEEIISALKEERLFNRLRDIELDNFELNTLFVDPPRSGLDSSTREFASGFENIIYISCNPLSCARDIEELKQTHKVEELAMFDQFPYTHHLEMGVVLKKR